MILVNFIRLPQIESDPVGSAGNADGVYLYATELLSLGLLWHGFHDAIKEGDGERILRHWKFMLVTFKTSNHRNYAKEAVNLLLQYNYLFSDRQKAQLLWNRCVNTTGRPGANIPCDLHDEHLNRRFKIILRGQGANVNPRSVERAGKSIASVHHICQIFEEQTASTIHSDHHPIPEFGRDFNTILQVLEEENVFVPTSTRQHKSFKFKCGILEKLSCKELIKKVKTSIEQLY